MVKITRHIQTPILTTLCFFVCMVLPFESVFASKGSSIVSIGINSEYIELGPYISFIEDKEAALTWREALEMYQGNSPELVENYDDILNLGITESVYWLFAEVNFQNQSAIEWFLEIAFPLLNKVDFFVYQDAHLKRHLSFDHKNIKASQASIKGSGLIFKISNSDLSDFNQSQNVTLILRIDSHALNLLPINLWSMEALAKSNNQLDYILGFFFGLLFVIAFYNAVVFIVTKDKSYLYYFAYLISSIAFFVVYSGVLFPFFPEKLAFANERLPLAFAILAMAFSLKFVASFLSLSKFSRLKDSLISLISIVLVLCSLVSIQEPYAMIIPTALLTSIFAMILFYIIVFTKKKGAPQANIVLVSYFVWSCSLLTFVSSLFGVIQVNTFTQIILYGGVIFQVLVLSLALAGKISDERRKRFQALIRENQAVQDLRRVEEMSLEKALLDPLTGLPNRAALERLSKDLLENKDGKREPFSVLFIHLQSYYDVSHTLGFRSSDLLIEKAAGRLNRIAAEIDDCIPIQVSTNSRYFVCKLDSASFVVMFRQRLEKQNYVSHAQHILELLNRPIAVHDMNLDVNAVIGMSFSPEHSTNIFTLVRFAQAAVEAEVELGNNKNVVALYSSIVSQQSARKLKLINDLRTAVKNNELYLVFQPQVDLRERKIVSIEALLRWKHPELGEISPIEFVILAEQTGLIHELSDWVVRNALDSLLWLMERGLKLRLAINISARNLSEEDFAQKLFSLLEKHKLDPGMITLELTETSLMHNPEQGIHVLKQIHAKGVAVAIDDFGAGYSSFAFIKQLPLSELKIDRSFVSQIDSLHSDRVITKSSIALAHELGARVCAEGVESSSCLQILAQFECDLVQGFHIAKPMSKDDLLVWVDESHFGA